MPRSTKTRKQKQGLQELLQLLEGDNLVVTKSDPNSDGKSQKGELLLQFKRRKYAINVDRNEQTPDKRLNALKRDADMLIFRKNRKRWKVYMDLNDLLLLLLNNRS